MLVIPCELYSRLFGDDVIISAAGVSVPEDDPLTRLMNFLNDRNIRPVELFRSLEKNKDNTVSREQFISGLKKALVDFLYCLLLATQHDNHAIPIPSFCFRFNFWKFNVSLVFVCLLLFIYCLFLFLFLFLFVLIGSHRVM